MDINKVIDGTVTVLRNKGIQVYPAPTTPVLYKGQGHFYVKPIIAPKTLILGFRLADPTKIKTLYGLDEALAHACAVDTVMLVRDKGVIWFQYALPKSDWSTVYYAGNGIGIAQDGSPIDFAFTEAAPHTIVGGSTGSGKSELIRVILKHLEDQGNVRVVIVDPKQDYTDLQGAKFLALPVASSEIAVAQAINKVYKELQLRIDEKLYNEERIVLVIDEAQSGVAIGTKASGFVEPNLEAVTDIAQRGRQVRINLIIGTQDPNHTDLPRINKNLTNKFYGKVADQLVASRLAGEGIKVQNLLGYGDFFHVQPSGVVRFQAAIYKERSWVKGVMPSPFGVPSDTVDTLDPYILAEFMCRPITQDEAKLLGVKHGIYTEFAKQLKDGMTCH